MYDYSDYVSKEESFWDMLLSNSIYQNILQWLVVALLIAILIFVILIYVNLKKERSGAVAMNSRVGGGIVFCQSCGAQCDVNEKICPRCGNKRS